jgi:hypothetical protein
MDKICGICGEESNKYMYKLNCTHEFHYECLAQSFKIGLNRNCPICRTKSGVLPMINGCSGPTNYVHYDYDSSIDDIDNLKKYEHKRCDHILTRGKNNGNTCNKKCVTGYYKCSNHLQINQDQPK